MRGVKRVAERIHAAGVAVLVAMLRCYQLLISPWLGSICRFEPSCSHYAIGALRRFGVWRGSLMAIARVGRCHPFHPGGYDPVPPGDR